MASAGKDDSQRRRTEILPFHLPKENSRVYTEDDIRETKDIDSKFTAWMECNRLNPEARTLRYAEFPSKWTWHQGIRAWRPRLRKSRIDFRLANVPPSTGEAYHLRRLLDVVTGPTSFEDIRTVEGVVHPTFANACTALDLMANDNQAED